MEKEEKPVEQKNEQDDNLEENSKINNLYISPK